MNLTLTRSDLEMMLDEMDKNNANDIEVEVCINGYEWELVYIDFDMYGITQHGQPKYIKTVLTLEWFYDIINISKDKREVGEWQEKKEH